MFHLGPRTVPDPRQFLPDSRTQSSSLIPLVETHDRDLNITDAVSKTRGSSSPELMPTRSEDLTSRQLIEAHDGPAISTGAGLFPGARDFVIKNSAFTFNQPQGESNTVTEGMKALSERVIEGAEYDSALRDPPPQCHPGTRVQLMEKIIAWFRNNEREKALLWLNGPAGVGKSAVIQTVAESLSESNSLGATLFFSRLNDRNDPQRVFITLAFQLATQIPAYKVYITERIALNPNLLKKGMKEQFRIFIAEPFGKKGIGREEGPWAVFLDGLDECEGVDEQSRIVRLVSEFVVTFPNTPLIWAIASRPEPHIVATFNDEAVALSSWSEYIPVDSNRACQDVEHYLDASFKAMRKPFPHLPPNWPSETQFLKLTNGALGLFAFARTAVRFMEDPDHADPVSRLNLILSIIDRLDIKMVDDHPFALLDALYTQILRSIPSSVWANTKRLLGFVICTRPRSDKLTSRKEALSLFGNGLSYTLHPGSRNLMGASVIFGLELSVAYSSLHKLHSVLGIPDTKGAHQSMVRFFHASFGDYLTDRVRSKGFYIDRGECVDDITRGLFQLCLDKPWVTNWGSVSISASDMFYQHLRKDAWSSPEYILTGVLRSMRGRGPLRSQQDRLDCLSALSQVNIIKSYKLHFHGTVATLLMGLWKEFREELESTKLFKEVLLGDLKVDHLDYERYVATFAQNESYPIGDSSYRLKAIRAELRKTQLSHPKTPVIIYGSSPENSFAFFAGQYDNRLEGYFCLPYPY